MAIKQPTLSEAIDEYLTYRRASGISHNTCQGDAVVLGRLLQNIGNMKVRSVMPRHIDHHFTAESGRLQPSSINMYLGKVKIFFKWCGKRRYLGLEGDPTEGQRLRKAPPRKRLRIPSSEFGRIMDTAIHPVERLTFALGIYLLLRGSEIRLLKVGDLNLPEGEINVTIPKTGQSDTMPISAELDAELRTWLTFYTDALDRPLRATDHLVPAIARGTYGMGGKVTVNPDRPVSEPFALVQYMLQRSGYELRDPATGKSLREGVHTLRRSAARALFDQMAGDSVDGAMRHVQALLHHQSVTMTERYLGLEGDRALRDIAIKGKFMYGRPDEASNVRHLSAVQ